MGAFFIGIDFGTVHTKACVREDIAEKPSPVVLVPNASGAAKYLLPSNPVAWTDRDAPKVLLCGSHEIHPPERENSAMECARSVVERCIRAAVKQVDLTYPKQSHTFMVQLGLPTDPSVMDPVANIRYGLIADTAIESVGDKRVRPSAELLDERIAPLALLRWAKFELDNEPLMVVDGGGWTTHASFLRWVKEPAGVSIHGAHTVKHGVASVVQAIGDSLDSVTLIGGEAALDGVMAAVYSVGATRGLKRDVLDVSPDDLDSCAKLVANSNGISADVARKIVEFVLSDFVPYIRHKRLEEVWDRAWREGYTQTKGQRHYGQYRLVLLGGASRIGRRSASIARDPVATRLCGLQESRTIPFTEVIYPELNQQFWTFDPLPEPEAVPYLFVAGGYTLALPDWPRDIPRSMLTIEKPRERRPYEDPESEPG